MKNSKRHFLKTLASLPAVSALGGIPAFSAHAQVQESPSHKFKLSLNVYSFNGLLRAGKIDLFDVLDFCAECNLDAIDPTGYYFPGYPDVPSDGYINEFKREAFLLGLDISGTGIRNDFSNPDPAKRKADIEMIKKWVEASAKMGAPHVRIFTGRDKHEGFTREQVFEWMAKDIKTCCKYGEQYGVMVTMQNHNEFLKTADDVDFLFEMVGSPWLGLNLDPASYRLKDPYQEVEQNIEHAVTWQIKENVWVDGKETPTDFMKLFRIIKKAGYRGYLPLETLGDGDPYEKIQVLLADVRNALKVV